MLIVEGPEGTGKTTLVESLAKDLELPVGDWNVKDRNQMYKVTRQGTYTAFSEAIKGDAPAQVWDRLFWSEIVYGPVIRQECQFSHEEITVLKRMQIALGCPIIVCLPPYPTVLKNVLASKPEQMESVKESLQHIYSHYRQVFSGPRGQKGTAGTGMPWVMWYDYTNTDPELGYRSYNQLLEGCEHYLSQRQCREWEAMSV